MLVPTYPITLFILKLFLFLYLQGLNLLELAAHLEEKAAQLRCEGLGRINSSCWYRQLLFIRNPRRASCHVNLDTSVSTTSTEKSEKKITTEEKTSDVPDKNASHSF